MKSSNFKFITIIFLIFASFSVASAQFSLGAGLVYQTDSKQPGINLRANYQFNEEWKIVGGLTVLTNEYALWSSIILNANYFFLRKDNGKVYALTGLNLTGIVTSVGAGVLAGIEVGAGGILDFSDWLEGFAELKYILGELGRLEMSVGVNFIF